LRKDRQGSFDMDAGDYFLTNGNLVRSDPYPPEKRSSGRDCFGRTLPRLPTKSPSFPFEIYPVGATFTLRRPKESSPQEIVKVSITKPVDVGWCKLSQAVLGRVNDGPRHLRGQDVFLKFFDPLYLNPDDLPSNGISPCYLICLNVCRF